MNVTIRIATIEDIADLQKLNQELFEDNHQFDDSLVMDWATGEKGKKYFTGIVEGKDSFAYVAYVDGKPVGHIACAPKIVSWRHGRSLSIDNMGISPEYRSKGVGSQLIMSVANEAKKQGYDRLLVSSYFHNNRANAFYKRNSFQEMDLGFEMNL